jgi:uncharacterized protein YecE (DUF72 family)
VLAQFPPSFRRTPANEDYLARLRPGLRELPAVVEFRHADWVNEAVFERLRGLGLGFACVDEPVLKGLLPPVAVATSPVAYVRFHGRNARQWHHYEEAWQRYDYRYTAEELQEWLPRIQTLDQQVQQTLIYLNNTPRGQGIEDARTLRGLLEK